MLRLEVLEQRLPFDGALPIVAAEVALDQTETQATDYFQFGSDEALKQALLADALKQYEGTFGQLTWDFPYWLMMTDGHGPVRGNNALAAPNSTPTQISGIDEADLVETDGRYLYILRASRNEVVIVDGQDATQPTLIGRVTLDAENQWGNVRGMYLHGSQLTVVRDRWGTFESTNKTDVISLDVSNPTAAQVSSRSTVEGFYKDSRMVGDRLILATQFGLALPGPQKIKLATPVPVETTGNKTDTTRVANFAAMPVGDFMFWGGDYTHRFETQAEYLARVEAEFTNLLPAWRTSAGEVSHSLVEAASLYLESRSALNGQLLAVTVLDLAGETPQFVASQAIPIGSVDAIFMSANAIYVASHREMSWNPDGTWNSIDQNLTLIQRIGIDSAGQLSAPTRAEIVGRVTNQFWMDEFNGDLRVVATDVSSAVPWLTNLEVDVQPRGAHVYVLRSAGDQLTVVGEIPRFSLGEQVFSVCYFGETAYVVTFPADVLGKLRPKDPLFAISLADPTQPKILGQLEISGFSDHLLPLDETHLLGVGREIDPVTGDDQGLQVSIFDVSDWTKPALVSRIHLSDAAGRINGINYGGWWQPWSSVDHHALTYLPESRLLSLPVNFRGAGWGWGEQTKSTFLMVQVGEDYTLTSAGQVNFSSPVWGEITERSVQIGNSIYFVSQGMVKSASVANPDEVLAEVDLHAAGELIGIPPVLIDPVPVPVIEWTPESVANGESNGETDLFEIDDLNEDSTFNIHDLLLGIFYFNQYSNRDVAELPIGRPRRADVNANGRIEITDMLNLVYRFDRPTADAGTETRANTVSSTTATATSPSPLPDPFAADIALNSLIPPPVRRTPG